MSLQASETTRIPVATYRIQLNKKFNFKQALRVTSYLERLGISDCYSSPILRARKGSTHGYDVTDHREINQELGTLHEFNQWVSRLHSYDMGFLLDIVPNHMAISDENRLLLDVLEYGPFSKYSNFFDIDWSPSFARELKNRLLLPILGTTIDEALRNHDISLVFSNGEFGFQIYSNRLPLTPKSYARILDRVKIKLTNAQFDQGNALFRELVSGLAKLPNSLSIITSKQRGYPFSLASRMKEKLGRLCQNYPEFNGAIHQILDELRKNDVEIKLLLREQFYAIEFWKDAINKANYRKFATVSDLIAIREERSEVFDEAHNLVLNLVADHKIDGLRIDHIDGLYDPSEYLSRLQKSCQISNEDLSKNFYVIVEKILGEGEEIPKDWQIYGTTGYEFLCDLNGIFVDSSYALKFDQIYSNFISKKNANFDKIVEMCRRKIIDTSMKSELVRLTDSLFDLVGDLYGNARVSKEILKAALEEVAIFFPVYRTYSSSQVSTAAEQYVELAIELANSHFSNAKSESSLKKAAIGDIRRILLLDYPEKLSRSQRKKWRSFLMRFQQFTAPIAAKGIEDTAFYIYNRLASLNEVGGNPERFGISLEEFHKRNLKRLTTHPHSLLATSTHDTKRSEDVRARINVLSEIPDQWNEALISWSNLNKNKKTIVKGEESPSKNDEYLLYQTMLGVWPLGKINKNDRVELIQRISSYMKKAVREAKVKTSWTDPDPEYEKALDEFIKSILDPRDAGPEFVSSFEKFQEHVSYFGMLNSLSQLLIKLTSPGVPDIYQGNEIWDFSLVDPDNRRPVDFQIRAQMLSSIERRIRNSKGSPSLHFLARDLVSNMQNGLIKMYVLYQSLRFRKAHEMLFKNGDYFPILAKGLEKEHVCAFMRKTKNEKCIVIAPRLFVSLLNGEKYQNAKSVWKDTVLVIPRGKSASSTCFNIFTGKKVEVLNDGEGNMVLSLSDSLDGFPVALIEPLENSLLFETS
jgi:(1->4)-alpha-D-glucan 1-alpha-D-glucosylmutase